MKVKTPPHPSSRNGAAGNLISLGRLGFLEREPVNPGGGDMSAFPHHPSFSLSPWSQVKMHSPDSITLPGGVRPCDKKVGNSKLEDASVGDSAVETPVMPVRRELESEEINTASSSNMDTGLSIVSNSSSASLYTEKGATWLPPTFSFFS